MSRSRRSPNQRQTPPLPSKNGVKAAAAFSPQGGGMFGDPHRGPTLLPQQRRAEVGVRGRRQPHLLADHRSEGAAGGQRRPFFSCLFPRPFPQPVSATCRCFCRRTAAARSCRRSCGGGSRTSSRKTEAAHVVVPPQPPSAPPRGQSSVTSSINLQWKMLPPFLIVYLLQTNVCVRVS